MTQNIQPFFGLPRKEKPTKIVRQRLVVYGALLLGIGCGDGALIQTYCELGHQCENDAGFVGGSEDSIDVCRVHIENDHRRLDANSESICGEIKEAHLSYIACVVTTSEEASTEAEQCDGLNLIFSPCHSERNTWFNFAGKSENVCDE